MEEPLDPRSDINGEPKSIEESSPGVSQLATSTVSKDVQSRNTRLVRTLKTTILLTVVTISVLVVVLLYLTYLAKRGVSGTELFFIPFIPIVIALPFLGLLSFIACIWLTVILKNTKSKVLYAVLGILFFLPGIIYIGVSYRNDNINQQKTEKAKITLLTKAEMLENIENCKIDNFEFGGDRILRVKYKTSKEVNIDHLPGRADPSGYDDYVRKVKESIGKCGAVQFSNVSFFGAKSDPDDFGSRWISETELKQRLQDCKIDTVNKYSRGLGNGEQFSGTRTSFALQEMGAFWHVYVLPGEENTVLGLAKNAQQKCGDKKPEISLPNL